MLSIVQAQRERLRSRNEELELLNEQQLAQLQLLQVIKQIAHSGVARVAQVKEQGAEAAGATAAYTSKKYWLLGQGTRN